MAAKETPVMQQHAAAKRAHPDCIVFFRLGDFYEMFGEDAVVAAGALDLTLTSRNKGKADEIPMAGVPHHAAHGYIRRLLERGFKVAICEQMADPSTVKGIVPREVVRVITPGTWTEAEQLDESSNNWLCALELSAGGVGVAVFDLTTAELLATRVRDLTEALSELARLRPTEVLLRAEVDAEAARVALAEVVPRAAVRLGEALPTERLAAAQKTLDYQGGDPLVLGACARVLDYAESCLTSRAPVVWRVGIWNPTGVVTLDRAAQRHLELVESPHGDPRTTLLGVLDRTRSAGGRRLLRRRLLGPLTDVAMIRRRLDQVETLVRDGLVRAEAREALSEVPDLERLVVRATLGEATPRDLGAIRRGLEAGRRAHAALSRLPEAEGREALGVQGDLDWVGELHERLARALVERPPVQTKEGAVFVDGYDAELDRYSKLRLEGGAAMTELEGRLREQTGISQLRVRFTRVFGWYVEVTRSQATKMPDTFRRKQTVATGERYSLPELDDLSEQIASAEDRYRSRELELFRQLVEDAARAAPRIHRLAAWTSELDVACALAEVAVDYDYQRPEVDDGLELDIVDGRHPVVERLSAKGRFVPNDLHLVAQQEHLWLISGPNMAGKSTFLRQCALIVLMAQMGSFVPAKSARVGIADAILSRLGASDNLAGGESTFLVEMRETASILRSSTARSFVILDEIGRGTSTFDGLSIAWAVVEHLDRAVGCRTLFATHYHELTQLGDESSGCRNYSVSAREHEGDIVFLHRVAPGGASRSYGVAVARLAGLPESVLARARGLLAEFENPTAEVARGAERQLDLFHASAEKPGERLALSTLRELDVDRLNGLEALNLLASLKRSLE
ncbi:MAG TPA: DNA mismatch repair protein MutS [Polyangiaceae bacterium]|nr:DNA mismatch repair protein MutS [Polyangiaceae bacterium]